MEEYAAQYQKQHRNLCGGVSNVTSYSFKFTVPPNKQNEQPKSYYVMKSWFLKL